MDFPTLFEYLCGFFPNINLNLNKLSIHTYSTHVLFDMSGEITGISKMTILHHQYLQCSKIDIFSLARNIKGMTPCISSMYVNNEGHFMS